MAAAASGDLGQAGCRLQAETTTPMLTPRTKTRCAVLNHRRSARAKFVRQWRRMLRRGCGARACLLRCITPGEHQSCRCHDGCRIISKRLRISAGHRRRPTQPFRGHKGDALVPYRHSLSCHVFVDGALVRPMCLIIGQDFCQPVHCSQRPRFGPGPGGVQPGWRASAIRL